MLFISDVILRAQCMAAFQTNLRLASPQTTTIPQIVLGTISITGGGILFSWCFNAQQRFQYPGHDFTVVVLTNIFYAFNAHPLNRKVLYETLWGTLPMQRLKALGYEKNVLHAYRMAMAFVVDCVKPLGVPVTFKGKKGEMDLRILCAGVMLVGFLVRPGRFTGWLKKKEKPQTGLHVVDEEVDEDASRPIVQ
ncbi:hypothetical protein BCR33DRAFT_476420 [Rhizoclosmatium globosum]|uniref:Uncharacterized protein n=1 Tax=Rhizoclosmatium globosum TaxID=329046 RepID=A0A1Y2BNV5_9FUNG|nr:hypothetical protein BCR33DRAFT_476420 [Rhizoclosmatium globosum]|eukprot:ORY36424.1 hypothetical protein BCR33DRAFT_476420 [Rhizoclosmatium globosum]